jgi:hypothetical protein
MLPKVVTRSFQLRHVSVPATTTITGSFYTASWNTAGTKQRPSCYAHAAKVHFTLFTHIKHDRQEVYCGVEINALLKRRTVPVG